MDKLAKKKFFLINFYLVASVKGKICLAQICIHYTSVAASSNKNS